MNNVNQVQSINNYDNDMNILIISSSYEDRCKGFLKLISDKYRFNTCFLINYDTKNLKRDKNLPYIYSQLEDKGKIIQIVTNEINPVNAMNEIYDEIIKLKKVTKPFSIDLDISTLNKKNLLMILQYLDDLDVWNQVRIFYTEPKNYITDIYLPMSSGLRDIKNVRGYISKYSTSLKKLLIIFLGYEGDRAFSIFEHEDPDEVILVAANPPYHDEWLGKTEIMNKILIKTLGKSKVMDMDSRNPFDVYNKLNRLLTQYPITTWRWSIVPIGTKPQTLGIYYFWRNNPHICSLIYASPLRHNYKFYSTGIGRTWLLKDIPK